MTKENKGNKVVKEGANIPNLQGIESIIKKGANVPGLQPVFPETPDSSTVGSNNSGSQGNTTSNKDSKK